MCKSYRIGNYVLEVLKNINLEIAKNEFIAFKGVSGSGKTTLLNLIGTLDRPDSGKIVFENNDIASLSKKDRYRFRADSLGFVFQNFNLIHELTVYENVELPLLISNIDKREEKVIAIVERVGLLSHLKHRPYELSGGQMQRVSIARALVKKPPLILADEPTANLDSANSASIITLMKELNVEYGVTFILATHDAYILKNIDRVIALVDGEVVDEMV